MTMIFELVLNRAWLVTALGWPTGLNELFAKHDTDNVGVLDLKEFTSLCQAPCTTVLKWGSQRLSDEQTIVTVSN